MGNTTTRYDDRRVKSYGYEDDFDSRRRCSCSFVCPWWRWRRPRRNEEEPVGYDISANRSAAYDIDHERRRKEERIAEEEERKAAELLQEEEKKKSKILNVKYKNELDQVLVTAIRDGGCKSSLSAVKDAISKGANVNTKIDNCFIVKRL